MRSDSGYVLVTVAALLTVLLGFTGLALDLGTTLSARTQMQRTADAAALAGVFTYIVAGPTADPLVIENALEVARMNEVMGEPVLETEVTIEVTAPDPLIERHAQVRATVRRTIPTIFGRVLGFDEFDVSSAQSVAEAGPATGNRCVKPLLIQEPIVRDSVESGEVVEVYEQANGQAPSQWGLMDFDGGGANGIRDNILGCSGRINCRDEYPAQTGLQATHYQSFQTLIGDPPPTFEEAGRYERNGRDHDTSDSLILMPVVDQNLSPGQGQNNSLEVVAFALVFIQSVELQPEGRLYIRVVNYMPCGDVPPSGSQLNGATVYGYLLRLVRPSD